MLAVVLAIAGTSCRRSVPPAPSGEPQPVSGHVLVDGRPVADVVVQLHPLNHAHDAKAPRPVGETDAEGRFVLRMPDGRVGAPVGSYHVSLTWPAAPGGADRLKGVYEEPEASGIVADIDADTTEIPPIRVGSSVKHAE